MLPMRPLIRRIACTLAVALAAWSAPARAQEPAPAAPAPVSAPHPACARYRAELASLSDGASVTRALQSEIGRLEAYHRSLNCEGGKFLFFDTRPPQCGAVEQRIRALNATYGGAASDDNGARRRQLQTFIGANCGPGASGSGGEHYARGGAQVICVRTCDGGFFPLSVSARRRDSSELENLCAALCPGVETKLYTRAPNREISTAVSLDGDPYTNLPNALKFQKSFDKAIPRDLM